MDNIETLFMEEEVFSLDDMEFGIKQLAKGKTKGIEGYQLEILKIGGPILIPHIFNQQSSMAFLKLGIKASLFLFLKAGIKTTPKIIRPL